LSSGKTAQNVKNWKGGYDYAFGTPGHEGTTNKSPGRRQKNCANKEKGSRGFKKLLEKGDLKRRDRLPPVNQSIAPSEHSPPTKEAQGRKTRGKKQEKNSLPAPSRGKPNRGNLIAWTAEEQPGKKTLFRDQRKCNKMVFQVRNQ